MFIGKILEIAPGVKAIVSSGYSTDPIMSDFRDYGFSGVVDVVQIQTGCCVNGMAWDGEHLWLSDKDMNDKIFEVDPSNGQVLRWINPPGDETWGMTWCDGYLWACEWTNDLDNYLVVKMEPTA